jgi:hypothetical protein
LITFERRADFVSKVKNILPRLLDVWAKVVVIEICSEFRYRASPELCIFPVHRSSVVAWDAHRSLRAMKNDEDNGRALYEGWLMLEANAIQDAIDCVNQFAGRPNGWHA